MHIAELFWLFICPQEINTKCIRSERVRRMNGYRNSSRAWRLNVDNSSILMLWTLVNDYYRWKRMWLTTVPKDLHIKFQSQQVEVWNRTSLSSIFPYLVRIQGGIITIHFGFTFESVLLKLPIPGFFYPHHYPPHILQIKIPFPGFRCLKDRFLLVKAR